MSDYLDIGNVPCDEPCQQVGMPDYDPQKAKDECARFIDAIRLALGPEPPDVRLRVKGHEHDFGTYYEARVSYETEEGAAYAFRAEAEAPTEWPLAMTLWTTCPPAYDGFGAIRPGEVDRVSSVVAEPQNRNLRTLANTTTPIVFHRVIVAPEHKDWQLGRYLSGGSAVAAGSVEETRLFGDAIQRSNERGSIS